MSIGFMHLSDIHFGQEKGGQIWIHEDVKESLIEDVGLAVRDLEAGRARGVIVTGDIAFGGRECEYDQAAKWLDRVADAAGCERTSIQVVPGNHDIDRSQITRATGMMLEKIATEGETALDEFLESEADRELLFRRFSAYRPFAEGYRCTLDTSAELSEERVATLVPGRSIRFIRLNSALVCSRHDEEGKLLLGARQRVMRERPGEELVVLCHHPLHWFRDSEDARRYVWNRARIFISGHEHRPGVRVESVDEGRDLMMLAGRGGDTACCRGWIYLLLQSVGIQVGRSERRAVRTCLAQGMGRQFEEVLSGQRRHGRQWFRVFPSVSEFSQCARGGSWRSRRKRKLNVLPKQYKSMY